MGRLVEDVMTKTVVTVREDAPFKEVVRLMDEYRVSALPVVDRDGRLLGVVSEADLLLKEAREPDAPARRRTFEGRRTREERIKADATAAGSLMTSPAITVGPDAAVGEAARTMHRRAVKRLPVVDERGLVVGIVSRRDLLHVFLREDAEIRREVSERVIEHTLWIEPDTVGVAVHEGVVTLRGELERRSVCSILVGLVLGVDGVVGVRDMLTYRFDDSSTRPEPTTPWDIVPKSLRM
jgi:CBS domain-containing protein